VHTAKRRGRTQSRILYWFRTPPSVRVGRAALDEDAIRLIEEHNPDVEFDWTRILKGQDAPEVKPRPEPERRPARPQRQRDTPREAVGPTPTETPPAPAPAPVPIEPEPESPRGLPADEPESAALSRLGPEGLLRLRARHAEVLARISEKITDPARRDELKSQAERLNPDTWVTAGDVTAGLEQYESVFESLRSVVGRRRKRRKRRGGQGSTAEPVASGQTAHDEPAAEPGASDDETEDE
jgi:hypothetical protein